MIKAQCSEISEVSHITMFTKKLVSSRLIISSLKAEQFQKLSVAYKESSKLFSSYGIELFYNRQNHLVTSAGESVRTFTVASTICNSAPQETSGNFIVDYDDLLKAQKDDKVLIIDVRENSEIQETGKLPGSIHIPMGDVTNVLMNLSNQEFEKKYGRKQPEADTKIILSCKLGKRSGVVQSNLQKLGYTNAYNYLGGWLEWESRQK